jgi:hypothetical protein
MVMLTQRPLTTSFKLQMGRDVLVVEASFTMQTKSFRKAGHGIKAVLNAPNVIEF